MKNEVIKSHDKINFCFVSSSLEIDHNDREMVEAIKTQNFSLLVHYFRKNSMKNLAINTLLQQRKNSKNTPVIMEIIYTYLYFEDYQGALDYIKHNEFTNKRVKPIEFLIKIHLASKHTGCRDDEIFNLIKEGLKSGYDRRFVKVLKDFYYTNCTKACLKEKFLEIQQIIEANHYHLLDYKEAKFLYKMMPRKHIFLKKMVKCNPLIKRKYYIEYANREGFQREDVIRILTAKYRKWAIKIAMYYGWIDEELRITTEMKLNLLPICINGKAKKEWLLRKDKHYHFHNKISREKFKSLEGLKHFKCDVDESGKYSTIKDIL